MTPLPKLRLLLPALVLGLLLAFPAAASATLAYTRNPLHPAVFAAADDGSGAHQLGSGRNPHVSPDGLSVAFLHEGRKHAQELQVVPAAGGAPRTVLQGWREPFYLAWSPDSSLIAALRGPEIGKDKLVVVDVATGAQSVVAAGYFSGFSFSPDGSELVYSVAASEKYPPRSNVFRIEVPVPGRQYLKAPTRVRLTRDHRSSDPLWGPTDRIVFVKTVDAGKRRYGPKNELYLMDPQGNDVERLTHTKVDPLLQGLFPTDWSADGSRLLAEFEGQDTSYAVAVDPETGAQRRVGAASANCQRPLHCRAAMVVQEIVGTALSSDGETVLGFTGGFEPGPNHAVVAVRYPVGRPSLIVEGAFEPDWSR